MQFGPSLVIRAFHRIRFGLGSSWGRASSSGSTSMFLRAFAMVPMQPSVDHGFVRSKIESTEPRVQFVRNPSVLRVMLHPLPSYVKPLRRLLFVITDNSDL